MGREANARKDRICKHCKKKFYGNADRIMKHTELCTIAIRSGLILPGSVERPVGQLVDPRGKAIGS